MEPKIVGAFGGYCGPAMQFMPDRNGLLTCASDGKPSALKLFFSFGASGTLELGVAVQPKGAPSAAVKTNIPGWITLDRDDGAARALVSRAWPAVRVAHASDTMVWRSSAKSVLGVVNGEPQLLDLPLDDGSVSEPWLVFFDHGWDAEDAAVLLTFTRRLTSLSRTEDGYELVFEGPGALHAMPLEGIKRHPRRAAAGMAMDHLIFTARAWVGPLLAYPTICREVATVSGDRVQITAQFTHEILSDDYGSRAEPLAPFPPAVFQASLAGYPVGLPADLVTTSVQRNLPTFYGFFCFVPGDSYTYSLPASVAAGGAPARERSSAAWSAPIREELGRIVEGSGEPNHDYIDSSLRVVAFLADALPELEKNQADGAVRFTNETILSALSTLTSAVEPVTAQTWWTIGKTWRAYYSETDPPWAKENARFDSEFYNGQALVAMDAAVEIDPSLHPKVLEGAKQLYPYSQIFWDWPTGSVLTMATGDGSNIDGVQFAWAGMGAMARIARRASDLALYTDAMYRAARQEVALFAMWHHAAWMKRWDYAIGHLSKGRLPPDEIATEGPIDAFSEEYGATALEFRSFWECTNFLFYSNRPLFEFYRRYGLVDRIRQIEYEIMPRHHPAWQDGNAMAELPDNGVDRYGGSFTATHLYARATLFGEHPAELFKVYSAARGSEASKTWYRMDVPEIAGPLMLALLEADVEDEPA